MGRHVLEGEWSGYVSAQQRVVHREVLDTEKAAKRFAHLRSIVFTDGTCLRVTVRPAKPREKVEVKRLYSDLIREAAAFNKPVVTVLETLKNGEAA